jgi:hypothetical protein
MVSPHGMVSLAAWQMLAGGLKEYLWQFWNYLDWINIGIFFYVISQRTRRPPAG